MCRMCLKYCSRMPPNSIVLSSTNTTNDGLLTSHPNVYYANIIITDEYIFHKARHGQATYKYWP